jgi:hypothetical protein
MDQDQNVGILLITKRREDMDFDSPLYFGGKSRRGPTTPHQKAFEDSRAIFNEEAGSWSPSGLSRPRQEMICLEADYVSLISSGGLLFIIIGLRLKCNLL